MHKKTSDRVRIASETGRLRTVMLHTPGKEVEMAIPENASKLLYNDLVYYEKLCEEHAKLKKILSHVATVLEVSTCLTDVLQQESTREKLIDIVIKESPHDFFLKKSLMDLPANTLAEGLIAGVPLQIRTLENYLSGKFYHPAPLPNMYFVRDTSVVIGDRILSCRMASSIRLREAILLKTIYSSHPQLTHNGFLIENSDNTSLDPNFSIEGGDILIVNENLILVGISERTTARGVDALITHLSSLRRQGGNDSSFRVLAVLLPSQRNTIHLDMIFTLTGSRTALISPPFVLGRQKCPVIEMEIDGKGNRTFIEHATLPDALAHAGYPLEEMIFCGDEHPLHQQREQWSSGANCFALAPGKVISYHHTHTLEAFSAAGFSVFTAEEIIQNPAPLHSQSRIVVAMEGEELSRGGGGPRCMTCPIRRDPDDYPL